MFGVPPSFAPWVSKKEQRELSVVNLIEKRDVGACAGAPSPTAQKPSLAEKVAERQRSRMRRSPFAGTSKLKHHTSHFRDVVGAVPYRRLNVYHINFQLQIVCFREEQAPPLPQTYRTVPCVCAFVHTGQSFLKILKKLFPEKVSLTGFRAAP